MTAVPGAPGCRRLELSSSPKRGGGSLAPLLALASVAVRRMAISNDMASAVSPAREQQGDHRDPQSAAPDLLAGAFRVNPGKPQSPVPMLPSPNDHDSLRTIRGEATESRGNSPPF